MTEKIGAEMRVRVPRYSSPVVRTPRWVVVLIGLLLVLLGAVSFFAWNFYALAKKIDTPLRTDDKTTVIQNIGNHVLLPVGEEPVFATVTDPAKLADQPFFVNAQTGDKVLVYTNAKKAILYRPSTDHIVEMMPIDLGATAF